jgi:D-glycero-beta-D-manno-heptose 1-phosphate adenylyltransferase
MSSTAIHSVLSLEQLLPLTQEYKAKNKKIVFTNGCFDLLHVGHIRYLKAAAALGDVLIVGLNTDLSVQKLKGPTRPIQNENDRAEILASLNCVTHSVLFNEETPLNLITALLPDILVKGGDWKPDQIIGSDVVLKNGGEVKSLLFIDGKSTTSLIEKSQR